MRMGRMGRFVLALAAPCLLASCLLTPGRFTSTLGIRKDRSFTFTYAGEAILLDPAAEMNSSPFTEDGDAPKAAPTPKVETGDEIAKRRAIAEALAKEVGYRSAEYLGGGKFRVDYALSGTLDRGFVFPFNGDAGAIVPWVAVEVRRDGTARVKAPAFGKETSPNDMGVSPDKDGMKERAGSFTFTTDAELLMQNNESGTAPGPGTKVVWQVTPTSQTVPTAVVRFAK